MYATAGDVFGLDRKYLPSLTSLTVGLLMMFLARLA